MAKNIRHHGKLIFLLALLIRLWGIGADLPNVYHPDEPHHLNIAARFGTGDLNPHDFKYPTLWPTVIAALFGFMYAMARLMHLVSSSSEFAVAFFYLLTIFYLAVRILSAVAVSLGVWTLYYAGKKFRTQRFGVVLGLLAAFTPFFIHYGVEATPYGLMLLMLCGAIYFLHQLVDAPERRAYVFVGLCLGLATSCHYTAGVFGIWLIAFHFLVPAEERNHNYLYWGIGACVVGFLIGTPFALLDIKTFLSSLLGLKNSQDTNTWNQSLVDGRRMFGIARNLVRFMDPVGIGFVLAAIGFFSQSGRKRIEYMAWLSPLVVVFPALALSTFGTVSRYMLGLYIVLMMMATDGYLALWSILRGRRWLPTTLAIVVFFPLVLSLVRVKTEKSLPDTRTEAQRWLMQNAPENTKVFFTDPYNCPSLPRSREQLERLYAKTSALNHPRQDYFKILLDGYPGGGYQNYFLRRTVQEITDVPERVEPAYAAQEWFDLEKTGLDALRAEGIHFVVIDYFTHESRANSEWLADLTSHQLRVANFEPSPGQARGPAVEIYDLTTSF